MKMWPFLFRGAVAAVIAAMSGGVALAQSIDIVASLDPGVASAPYGALVEAPDGSFLATTSQGGSANAGAVVQVRRDGTIAVLYAFTGGADGAYPYAGLTQAADGSYYGTTAQGGDSNAGTVFQITSAGAFTRIYSFTGGDDGGYPSGALIQTSDGSLYGTTSGGGSLGAGTVFRLAADGTFTTVYAFTGASEGGYPAAGVVQAGDGNLYGTTTQGGDGSNGTVYQLTSAGALVVLHAFTGNDDGSYPYAGVIQGRDGSFYGTTLQGGLSGLGTVYRVSVDGTFTVLHTFTGADDGAYPYAGVTESGDGTFFGAALEGGSGSGTIFNVTSSGVFASIYSFSGGADGAYPVASLILASDGELFGTTEAGGNLGGGTVFGLTALPRPTIHWIPQQPIPYGTPLRSAQLNATADVPGTFTYAPTIGTVLHAGVQTLSATFTPADPASYATVTVTTTVTVTPRTSVVLWATPAPIAYGTPLDATQLDARANVEGSFVYTPPAGTLLDVGTSELSVLFVPFSGDYTTATGTVSITVVPAAPVISWTPPAAIRSGTPLGPLQLDAATNVAGTFDYDPPAGTVLDAGSHILTVTFTPDDTTNYTSAVATVPLIVAAPSDFTTSGGGNVYPLQFTPAAGARGLVVAGYALVADPVAGLRVLGNCSYNTVHSGSGRGGGYHTVTTYYNQTCTWDLYGNLLTITPGLPVAPPPVSVTSTQTIYATDPSGVYTGTDSTVPGRGFVYTPGAHYTWLTSNAYAVLQQQTPYTFTITLKSDGDLPLTVFGAQASAVAAQATVNSTTCSGAIPVGSTCSVTVTYDPSALRSPTGLAYDTLDVKVLTDAGQAHDFVQRYTIVVALSDEGN